MPKLTYLGHAAFIVESSSARFIIDPFLTGNPVATRKAGDVKVDFVLLSHAHGDHLGDAIAIAKANDATVIAANELALYCGSKGAKVHPLHIGGGFSFPFGRVKLTIAHHGSVTDDGTYGGEPAGILLTVDGKTLYHSGDTGLFLDMQLIGEMNKIDVALLPIGDNYTMGIVDAVRAAELLKPGFVIPMHYNTWDVIKADPDDFIRRIRAKGIQGQVVPVDGSYQY